MASTESQKANLGAGTPRAGSAANLRRLWSAFVRRHWGVLALAGVAMAIYAASYSAIPLGLEWIMNAFNAGGVSASQVMVTGPVVVIVLGVVNALAQFAQQRFSAIAALRSLRDIQQSLYRAMLRLDMEQLERHNIGQLTALFTTDPMVLRESLQRVARAAGDLLTIIGLCAVLIHYDWLLFLAIALIYGGLAHPLMVIAKRVRKTATNAQEDAGRIAAFIAETVHGIRQIKSFNAQQKMGTAANRLFEERRASLDRVHKWRAMNEPLVFLIGATALAMVVGVVSLRISSGALRSEEFVAFIATLFMLSQPARGLSSLNAALQEGVAAFTRMCAVLDEEPSIQDAPGAVDLTISDQISIVFDNVVLRYDEGPRALDGFSLTVEGGEHIALVGESGAGKTSVFAALARLHEIERGTITINGVDIRQIRLESLHRHMALVTQEPFLFDDTIAANIAFGREGADAAAVEAAAKQAAAHDFIQSLPRGYDTPVGTMGARLSGGQRQRIALARAFLKDAPIILLDEPTSALDASSEAQIQEALERLKQGRATISIAHRLSTVRNCRAIAYMERGVVTAFGPHERIIEISPGYAALAQLQFLPAAQAQS